MNRISALSKYLLTLVLLIASIDSYAQCATEIRAVRDTIACGESLLLENITLSNSPTSDNFSGSTLGGLWAAPGSVSNGWTLASPCGATPTGQNLWFANPSVIPRKATTVNIDASCGGTVCFDFRMETQSAPPCDGPDQANEAIYIQYKNNTTGGAWTTFQTFLPGAIYTGWNNYCYPIPAGAITGGPGNQVQFRWIQLNASSPTYDLWGIDNVDISLNPPCGIPYTTNFFGPNVPSPYAFDTITVTPYTDSAIYSVYVTNGTNFCTDSFTVYVEQPSIETDFLSSACLGSDTLDAQATITANCDYTLELLNYNPTGAETGWSTGATPATYHNLDVHVDGTLYSNFTMTTGAHGSTISFPIPVTDGDLLETYFSSLGSYANECSYKIYDSQGNLANTGIGNAANTGLGAVPLNTYFNAHLQFNIINGGTGYNSPPYNAGNPAPIITLTGGGCIVDTIYANSVQFGPGVIMNVMTQYNGITNGATGCTSAPTITVTGGGGSGAAITASLIDDAVHVTCPATATYNYAWTNITSGGTLGLNDANIQNPLATVGINTDFQVIAYDSLHPLCIAIDTVIVPGNSGIGTFDLDIISANPLCSDGVTVIDFEITSPNGFVMGPFYCELITDASIIPISFPSLPFAVSLPPAPLIAGSYNFEITTIYDVSTIDSCPIYPTTNPSIVTLDINDPPYAGITIIDPINLCQNEPIDFYLPNAIGGVPDLNGIWSCVTAGNPDITLPFNGFNYQLDPSILPAANWLYQYTVSGLAGCPALNYVQTTVVIEAAPTAGILPTNFSVCLNGPTLDLNSLFNATTSCPSCIQPSPFSGTNWTDITAGGLSTPIGGGSAIPNINNWMPLVAGTYILRYTANPSATCPFQDTEEVTIIVNTPPSTTIGTSDLDNTVCLNELVNLDFNIVGNIGNYNISYFDYNGTPQNVLVDENSNLITTGNPITIPTGAPGNLNYTIQQIDDVNTGCIDITSSQVTLTIVSPPYSGISTNNTICEDDFTIYNLNDATDVFFPTGVGVDVGGAWDFGGNPVLGGTFQAANNLGNSVDPFGVYTYTVTDLSGVCPADITNININPELPPNTGNALPNISICDNDIFITNYDLNQLLDGSQDPGGNWTDNLGISVPNPIDLSSFVSGATYTFIYELNPAAGSFCTNNGNLPYTISCNLLINPEPQIDPASLEIDPDPITQGQITDITVGMLVGSPPFTINLLGNEVPMGTYAPFVITSGMIGQGSITPNYDQTLAGGIVTVTVTSVSDNNGCTTNQIETTTVEVTPYPIITATTSSLSICEENLTDPLMPLNLILEATQGIPNIDIEFSINGSSYSSPGDINSITSLNTATNSDIRSLLNVGSNLIQFTKVTDGAGNMCPNNLLPTAISIEVFSTPQILGFSAESNKICEGNGNAEIQFDFATGTGSSPFNIQYNYTGSGAIQLTNITHPHTENLTLPSTGIDYIFNLTNFTDNNGCNGLLLADFSVEVNETPVLSLNNFIPSEICETNSITLFLGTPINTSVDAPPYTVVVNNNGIPSNYTLNNDGTEISGANAGNLITYTPINAGVYPYTITSFYDNNGCGTIDPINNTAVLTVNETADMIVTSTADTGVICIGDRAYLNFDFTGGIAPWVIEFLKDGNLITLPPYSNDITIPQGIYNNITSYDFISINDAKGCIKNPYNKQFDVVANNLPIAELLVDGDRFICDDGSTTNIEFNFLDGSPTYKVNYSVGFDNRYVEFNSPNPPTIPTNESGIWKINKVVDGNECSANELGKEVFIEINPLPIPNFVTYPQPTNIHNPVIHFVDNSEGHIAAIWNFDNGNISDTIVNNITILYEYNSIADTHFVSLEIISDSGCVNTITNTIIINEAFSCFIPDAFSPNNDLNNDYFVPIVNGVNKFKLEIYDRQGNRIFSTDKFSNNYCMFGCEEAWDGKINNSEEYAITGVYVYKIEIIDYNGKERNFEGEIKLMR